MENEILLIDKEQVRSLCSQLNDPENLSSCIEEVRKMIDIKSALCWRADERSGCCGPGMPLYLYGELQTLERTLQELESENISQAVSLLEHYEEMMLYSR